MFKKQLSAIIPTGDETTVREHLPRVGCNAPIALATNEKQCNLGDSLQPSNFSSSTRIGTQILLYAVVQFLFFTLVAMYVFPGGNYHEKDAARYVFSKNFFSDLGSTKTFSGESNLLSLILFSVSLSSIGAAMIHHSFFLKFVFPTFLSRGLARMSLLLGGKSFIGVAIFPLNLFPTEHNFFVKAGFLFLLCYVLCLIYLQFQMTVLKNKVHTLLNISYLLTLIIYLYILFWGPDSRSDYGLILNVVSQKIIVYFSILNLGLQTWGIDSYLRKSHRELKRLTYPLTNLD